MQFIHLRPPPSSEPGEQSTAPSDLWIDVDASDNDDRDWLREDSELDESTVSKLLVPSTATHWRRVGRGIYFHMRLMVPENEGSKIQISDFAFWLEPGRIITVRHGDVPALDRIARACEMGSGPSTTWGLIVSVLEEGLHRMEQILYGLAEMVDGLEDEVMSGEGPAPIYQVAELQKRLVYARRFRAPLSNMVSFLSSQLPSVGDGSLRDELDAIVNVVAQHKELLDLSIDRASTLQGQVRDQLSDAMNSATYRFTWVATVFLPLGFLTGLLGINVAGIPGDHDPFAFWSVCGVLGVIAVAWGILVGRVTGQRRRPPRS